MTQHGKRYRNVRAQIDREQLYAPAEAVHILKQGDGAKFDETVEAHFNLGLNVRHADQQLRGTISLPHGTGKEQRIAVFAEGEKAREAQEAGADVVGSADLAKRVEEGFTDFDVAIATPDQMAVREAKAGKQEYRTDRGANVHISIGKKSFEERQLLENYAALVDEIVRAKPAAAKGRYIRKVTLTTTMGPGINVDPARTRNIVEEEAADSAETASATVPA
jgi:large subunit ribosomal protein L1